MVWPWAPTKPQKGWTKELNQHTNTQFLWKIWKKVGFPKHMACIEAVLQPRVLMFCRLQMSSKAWSTELLHLWVKVYYLQYAASSKSCLLDLSRVLLGSEEPRCYFFHKYIYAEILFEYLDFHTMLGILLESQSDFKLPDLVSIFRNGGHLEVKPLLFLSYRHIHLHSPY